MFVFYKLSAILFKRCAFLFIMLVFFSVICYVVLFQYLIEEQHIFKQKHNYEIIPVHWFNLMSAEYSSIRTCYNSTCHFTGGDDPLKVQYAKAVLFYGSDMDNELPLPRPAKQIWALLHEESPKNIRYLSNPKFIQHFNLTSTMSRYSDNPLTLLYLPSLELLVQSTYYKSVAEKSNLVRASVLFIQTDCSTPTRREDYVKELMEYIPIDSYGSCLNNKEQPDSISKNYLNNLYSNELLHLISTYKFTLSIENAVCEDYITEKFWRPLVAGSVALYFGSPSIRDWAPNEKSVIYIDDFPSAKDLAEYLMKLDKNDTEYETYLTHKTQQKITNERLKNEYSKRAYKSVYSQQINYMMDQFECNVCNALSQFKADEIRQANIKHYDCPFPPPHPPLLKEHATDDWESIMQYGQCEAYVMDRLLRTNVPYKKSDVKISVLQLINSNHYSKNMCQSIDYK